MTKKSLQIKEVLALDPKLADLYQKIKKYSATVVSSTYDVTDKCNLRCEGCLFFSGDDYKSHLGYGEESNIKTLEGYDLFFKKESDRGVNFAYFAGGSPLWPFRWDLLSIGERKKHRPQNPEDHGWQEFSFYRHLWCRKPFGKYKKKFLGGE